MSTKIYNGFRMPKSFDSLNRINDEFREKGSILMNSLLDETVVKMSVRNLDIDIVSQNDTNKNYIMDSLSRINDEYREIKTSSKNNPYFDFECELSIMIPPSGDHIYLIAYTCKDEYIRLLESIDGVEEYAYWNNTDPPDDIDEDIWDQRGKDWDAALGETGIPARNGFSFELVGPYLPFSILNTTESLDKFCPSKEQRISSIASDISFKEWVAKNKEADAIKNNVFEIFSEHSQFLKTEDGKKSLEDIKQRLDQILPDTITKNMITGKSQVSNTTPPPASVT